MPAPTPTWFVTGTSSGFGAAFAEYALSRGYNVVATARDAAKLAGLQSRAGATGAADRLLVQPLDVTDAGAAGPAVEAAVGHFGRIDVLINNAGYGIVGAVEETADDELRAIMDTNFFGALAVTRAALPLMRRQRAGAIVQISSLGGQVAAPGFGAYAATKFALEGASEALAAEVKPFGIKVLIVEPGAFRTGFAGGAMRRMPETPEYRGTVGSTREFAHRMDGAQAGDPRKAARAIDDALRAADTPLRLPLGGDAVDAVRQHARDLLAELDRWEAVARDTRLDAAPAAAAA